MIRGFAERVVAVAWGVCATARARRLTRLGTIDSSVIPRVPRLAAGRRGAVRLVLTRLKPTCLVEALVWQAWNAAHGDPRDLVIGVRGGTEGFAAHAWLDGDATGMQDFLELMRHPAP